MAICRYCGKDAGLLKSIHKQCKQANDEGKKKIVELAAAAALSEGKIGELKQSMPSITASAFIHDEDLKPLLVRAWEKAVSQALEDNILTEEEESGLNAYAEAFELKQDDLNTHESYTNLIKSAIIRDVLNGKTPTRIKIDQQLPFNFKKGEILVWLFQHVPYSEQRTRTTYEGSSSGISVRIAKGIYYRMGAFKGKPIVTTNSVTIDNGLLGITDKHIYFSGPAKSFRIPYDKIVAFQPYSDGIAIQRDSMSAKPQVFITNDGWFTYNLITNLAHRHE